MGPGNLPPYGSQAGAMAHVMQGTQIPMMQMGNIVSSPTMAAAAESSAQVPPGSMAMPPSTPGQDGKDTGTGEKRRDIEAPDSQDIGENFWELLIGACAGGAFIGGFASITAPAPVAVAAAVAAPVAATAIVSAMGVGCALGMATASTSLGAIQGWRRLVN
jgi:hypothetical protein